MSPQVTYYTHWSLICYIMIIVAKVSIQISECNDRILFCLLYYLHIICTDLVQFYITKLRNLVVSKINDNYG